MFNRGDGARDFARDKRFAAPGAFMVEQNAVARAKTVTFTIVYRRPERKNLCHAIRAARPERRLLSLRYLLRLAKHFAARCLIKTRPQSGFRSEEHTSELQSQSNLVCRLLLEKKKPSVSIYRYSTPTV